MEKMDRWPTAVTDGLPGGPRSSLDDGNLTPLSAHSPEEDLILSETRVVSYVQDWCVASAVRFACFALQENKVAQY